MATTIKLKNSVTSAAAPATLVQGEAAVNVTDKKVWVGNAASSPVQILGAGATIAGTTAAFSGVATFSAGTVSAPAITTTGDTNTGIFFPAADTIAFTEGGAESMRITSAGNLGIGTTSAAQKLQIGSSSADDYIQIGATGSGYVFGRENATGEFLFNATQASPYNIFKWQQGGTERMRIDADGDLGVGTNNPQYRIDVQSSSGEQIARFRATTTTTQSYITISNAGTMYVGLDNSTGSAITNSAYAPFVYSSTDAPMSFFTNAARTVTFQQNGAVTLKGATQTSSGTGITFPATQSASSDANTLDDYEEGTWSPVLTSAGGTLTAVTNGTGYYTKVGNVVTVTCRPVITVNGTGSSALRIAGLPFAANPAVHLSGAGREDAALGDTFGISANSSTSLYIQNYNHTYPGGNGYAFAICLTYLT